MKMLCTPLRSTRILIYKSIQEAVKALEGTNLFKLPPEFGDAENPRTMLITASIYNDFAGPFPDTVDGERRSTARALLDAFTLGDDFTVGADPHDKDPDAMMARVDPVGAEVFDFRSFDCRSGIRVFGCFTSTDEFIALTWQFREDLGTPEDWDAAIADCMSEWTKLFGPLPAHSGDTIDAYFSYGAEFV
jgi:hypothetical protein